jgi:ankyrin repeat protein
MMKKIYIIEVRRKIMDLYRSNNLEEIKKVIFYECSVEDYSQIATCFMDSVELISHLCDLGADLISSPGIHCWVTNYNGDRNLEVMKYLIDNGADIRSCEENTTRWVIEMLNIKYLKFLIENGCDIMKDIDYLVQCAAFYGQIEILEYLISMGGKFMTDSNGKINNVILEVAISRCDFNMVKKLLDYGVEINKKKYNTSAFFNSKNDLLMHDKIVKYITWFNMRKRNKKIYLRLLNKKIRIINHDIMDLLIKISPLC